MSLPSSFTIQPRVSSKAVPTTSTSAVSRDEDTTSKMTSNSSFRTIQLSFSAQENKDEVQKQLGPTTTVMPKDPKSMSGVVAPPFPPIEDHYARRSIRISPFEPMAHLRRMPRNGTISPLRIHEYQEEMESSGRHVIHDQQSASSLTKRSSRPPLEVCIPASSNSSSPDDGTLTSSFAISPSAAPTTHDKDYKTLYLQSQKEVETLQKEYRALQKLQERTLGENHLLRSRVKVLVKRHQQQQALSGGSAAAPANGSARRAPAMHSLSTTPATTTH